MKLIENEYYYHIQRAQTNQWEIGKTYFIGKEKNEFVSHFDTTDVYCPNDLHQSILTLLNKNENVPNDMLIYTLNNYLNVSNHYKKLAREYVFEEVRADFFPNLPSRQKCLWVMPVNEEILSYWWQYINGRILKLKLTGKIYKTNQQFLSLTSKNLNFIREQAFKYWAGASGTNNIEEEWLFEGFATVESIHTPEELGLKISAPVN